MEANAFLPVDGNFGNPVTTDVTFRALFYFQNRNQKVVSYK